MKVRTLQGHTLAVERKKIFLFFNFVYPLNKGKYWQIYFSFVSSLTTRKNLYDYAAGFTVVAAGGVGAEASFKMRYFLRLFTQHF